MGDLFNQRRAAAAKRDPAPLQQQKAPVSSPRRPASMLDIQAEQERSRGGGGQERSRGGGPSRDQNRGGGDQNRRDQNRGGSYNRSNDSRRGRRDYSDLPLEQGSIRSLKDSFGFIYCADRPDELFFHYSEVSGGHATDLQVDDEVEFRVGQARNDDKMAAFCVKKLEPGTIEWEYEEEPGTRFQGLVERPVRNERGSSQMTEGTIRMLVPDEEEGEATEDKVAAAAAGPLVLYTASDYEAEEKAASPREYRRWDSSTSNSSRAGRLGRNDLVEFTVVTERRTGSKYAKSIKMLQSDRERQRLAKEHELLANATLEQGVVTTLKTDFGFLRSNRRREEVYFHYSQIDLPEEDGEDEHEFVLKEGQDMEFLVLTETGKGGKDKLSAREVKVLPKGSVVFHTVIAEGVTGVVTRPPHPADAGYSSDMVGRVRLSTSVEDTSDDGASKVIDEVLFHAVDAPGGSYAANRDGSSVGLWVREGDTLLFDLVKDVVDGSFRVAPTKHLIPVGGESSSEPVAGDEVSDEPAVRLIAASLAGRAEGFVHAIKDNYGFISCTERPVDTYFRLYELLPDQLQNDMRRNMGIPTSDNALELKIGAQVHFDLALQGTIASSNPRSRQRPGNLTERENLKAQRLLLLPPGTIMETKIIAKDAKGVVSKEDPKQTYSGMIEFEESYQPMSLEERHPLVAQLIQSILEDDSPDQLSTVYHDIQSTKEDEVVMHMVEVLGKGSLTCSHIPVSGHSGHPGRLCISRRNPASTVEVVGGVNPDEDSEHLAADASSDHASDAASAPTGDESPQASSHSKHGKKKRKPQKVKDIKTVRFDKHCLAKELLDDIPPGKDDVVICDIVQSRRTGMVELKNVRVTERSETEEGEDGNEGGSKASGVGIVTEVVAASKFGFISLLDENASKREMLFFQLSSVISEAPGSDTPTKRNGRDAFLISKGDEVKFDIGIGKKGKRTAVNIHVVPRGTLNIPTKADKNACRGLVLMEPSHTSLSNTPSRQASRGPVTKGNSRWDNVGSDHSAKGSSEAIAKEEGCILLVHDPTNMFSTRKAPQKDVGAVDSSHPKTDDSEHANEDEAAEKEDTLSKDAALESAIGTRVPFKNGAIAIHGAGASSMSDGSSGPRRGDLVSFVKAKSGKGVRDVRVVTRGSATLQRGRLENISLSGTNAESFSPGSATFVAATENEEQYEIDLAEVVSCDPSRLKENESVEGILHDNKIYGVCRTCDLYLGSKLGSGHAERPKLNLTVRKELKTMGGKIMAQSSMAKVSHRTAIAVCRERRRRRPPNSSFRFESLFAPGSRRNERICSWVDNAGKSVRQC